MARLALLAYLLALISFLLLVAGFGSVRLGRPDTGTVLMTTAGTLAIFMRIPQPYLQHRDLQRPHEELQNILQVIQQTEEASL